MLRVSSAEHARHTISAGVSSKPLVFGFLAVPESASHNAVPRVDRPSAL